MSVAILGQQKLTLVQRCDGELCIESSTQSVKIIHVISPQQALYLAEKLVSAAANLLTEAHHQQVQQ